LPWNISFHAWGEQFRPSQIDFTFTEAHDPGVAGKLGRYRDQPVLYGQAVIGVPHHVPNKERIRYIVGVALPLLPELKRAGATEWYLDIARYYSSQCNEEYSTEELALIAQLQCPLLYSAYSVSEEEELELESKWETFT
jgi:hypothetical protein